MKDEQKIPLINLVRVWLFGAIESEYVIVDPEGKFVPETNSCSSYRSKSTFLMRQKNHKQLMSQDLRKSFLTEFEDYEERGYRCIEIIEKPQIYIHIRDWIRGIIGYINKRTGRVLSHGFSYERRVDDH